MYVYIYIYIYNRHLGLINAPPLICLFSPNDIFHYSFIIKRPDIYKIMTKTLLIIFPPSWEDPLYNKC